VYGAIAYYLAHRADIDAYLERVEAMHEEERSAHEDPAFARKMKRAWQQRRAQYDAARTVWNARLASRPAAGAQCTSTADGSFVHASEEQNADLFLGLRGGGGNLGVVISLEFQLHEVGPEVLAGQLLHPMADAAEGLRLYRDVMADAPDELQTPSLRPPLRRPAGTRATCRSF
jgi:hypothetical protein